MDLLGYPNLRLLKVTKIKRCEGFRFAVGWEDMLGVLSFLCVCAVE